MGIQMKSKEELRSIQRRAYHGAIISATAEEAWEAALEALCRALPDIPEGATPWGSIEPDLVATKELYSQLKQYGKNK